LSAAVTSNLHRETQRERCLVHGIEFGQERIRNPETREWSPWTPPNCIECEKDFLRERNWREEVEKQVAEIKAEADKRFTADAGGAASDTEVANGFMAEDAAQYLKEFFALNRAKYEAYAAGQRWDRIADEVTAERREEFLGRAMKARE
jgi:hypothetical protein